MGIQIYSEVGKLRKVLLHRPGRELENLVPAYRERMLFDDIPYVRVAREEHDAFANVLREHGTEVVYLEDLLAEVLQDPGLRSVFTKEFLQDAGIRHPDTLAWLTDYYAQFKDPSELVLKLISGLRKEEYPRDEQVWLTDWLAKDYPFVLDPLPNLYFTRDPFATAGNGVSLHHMQTHVRNRETLLGSYVLRFHPDFRGCPFWYEPCDGPNMEGGDILVLSQKVIAVGLSQRTHPDAVELYARRILASNQGFTEILAFDIPKNRAFMHLDTVFTQVDRDKFIVHPEIRETLRVFSLKLSENTVSGLSITEEDDSLQHILERHLGLDSVTLIHCGGKSPVDAARDQWNDGSNTLCIAPGEVIVYERNYTTNAILKDYGIKAYTIPSSELSRGRGGPRCMSMPLVRDLL
ncbi:MAG: arginine deiminase [Lachnospiraceae bacterium]|nr:arginine deiminase [Lachnospiraceae bacterium]